MPLGTVSIHHLDYLFSLATAGQPHQVVSTAQLSAERSRVDGEGGWREEDGSWLPGEDHSGHSLGMQHIHHSYCLLLIGNLHTLCIGNI